MWESSRLWAWSPEVQGRFLWGGQVDAGQLPASVLVVDHAQVGLRGQGAGLGR